MDMDLIAKASTLINAPKKDVWDALVNPEIIRQYMFGTQVVSQWREGSPIVWKGEWQGKPYEDKGVILQVRQGEIIQYSHFSPLSGLPDRPENYHVVTIVLTGQGDQTRVVLTQDHNSTEPDRAESERNWGMMLASLKRLLEKDQQG